MPPNITVLIPSHVAIAIAATTTASAADAYLSDMTFLNHKNRRL